MKLGPDLVFIAALANRLNSRTFCEWFRRIHPYDMQGLTLSHLIEMHVKGINVFSSQKCVITDLVMAFESYPHKDTV